MYCQWMYNVYLTGSTNCYTGNTWNATLCPDGKTCAANCALDGADYSGTYSISTSGNALKLGFVTKVNAVGSIIFDVDVSNLPCGVNGALYFSEMDADGGRSKTGYCDSQCPQDLKFINGEVSLFVQ
ncbi:glycoside hydrolase family 7 protein [Hyaloscypha hepaticicola]|uniref:cellulose 1,4-beta-cellobiosidase (non-reducing end) n=1 Tax=Hyaloscypha hepaticicola TaxID=2082293 RepID=A0A2J6PXQ2_9HELO|nr:glycoside hydrolase family 7 protein [Hyaloscypha hepaticicola]